MATVPKEHKLYNLILPISLTRRSVLLGYKKRGFGVGKFNGFGGKVDPGETLVASAQRELEEESGIVCTEDQLHHHAVLLLETVAPGAEKEKVLEIHVFVCTEWAGEIVEYVKFPPSSLQTTENLISRTNRTEEMRPQWFAPDQLPLNDMWEETRVWMTTALELYLPLPPATAETVATSSSCGILPTELNPPAAGRGKDKKWFIHYVDFHGGINAQTGEWDPWHGMQKSVWEWFDTPLIGWSREKMVSWAETLRKGTAQLPN
jgi:8-oxo-dGTP pyrophosphatase MutT (NUDIX family)